MEELLAAGFSSRRELLASVPALQALSAEELDQILALTKEREFDDGQAIVTEGDTGEEMYIMQSGSANCTKLGVNEGNVLKVYSAGDFFGERAMLVKEPRAASITASGKVVTIEISNDAYELVLSNASAQSAMEKEQSGKSSSSKMGKMFGKMGKSILNIGITDQSSVDSAEGDAEAEPEPEPEPEETPPASPRAEGRQRAPRRAADDPMAFVAKSFGASESLEASNVEHVIGQVQRNLKRLDAEISADVRKSKSFNVSMVDMKAELGTILAQFGEIKAEAAAIAEKNEAQVEIRSVYQGAKGLLDGLDALTYLRELKRSIALCERHKTTGQYSRIGEQLAVQSKLKPYFGRFKSAPVVSALLDRIDEFQEDLISDIMNEFSASYKKADADMLVHLTESAKLMEAMGDAGIEDLTKWYCERTLQEFEKQPPVSIGDFVTKFDELTEELDNFDETYRAVFPADWQISKMFTKECCAYLRRLVDQVITATGPDDDSLLPVLHAARQFEESLVDRFAAEDATNGVDASALRTTSSMRRRQSMVRTRSRNGRSGSVVGKRPIMTQNWSGIISVEIERFMTTALQEEEEEARGLSTLDASALRTKSQYQREPARAAGGSALVPRLPRQEEEGGEQLSRAVAQPWDLGKKALQRASFESLLLVLATEACAERDDVYSTATEVVRVQMNVSRRQCGRFMHLLELPTHKVLGDLDLAAVHLARLQNVELLPWLHYRFLLLQTHRAADFDGDSAAFCEWFDRHCGVFLSGLFWTLENIALTHPEHQTVQLGNDESMPIKEAYFEVAEAMKQLRDLVQQDDDSIDQELFVEVVKGLEDDIESLYEGIDHATMSQHGSMHTLALPYPLNMELYTTALLTIFDQENWGELLPYSTEILVVLEFWRPFLHITDKMHRIALMRCHFVVYQQCLQPAALLTLEMALKDMRSGSSSSTSAAAVEPDAPSAGASEDEAKYEMAVNIDTLKQMEARLMDYHLNLDPDNQARVRGEFDVYVAMKFPQSAEAAMVKQREVEAMRFIKASTRHYFGRLVAAISEPTASPRRTVSRTELNVLGGEVEEEEVEEEGKLSGMCDLVEFLIDEGVLQVVEVAHQLKPYYRKAGDAAVAELVSGFKKAVEQAVAEYVQLDPEIENLIAVTRGLMETLIDLKGEANVGRFDVMGPFLPLVRKEFEQQQTRYHEVTDRCIATEGWVCIGGDQHISSSAVDIFGCVGQSVPMIIHSGLLLVQANIDTLVQNIESIVMSYGQFVVRSCGERPAMSKKKKDKGGGANGAEEPAYRTQTVEELCIRANNLEFAMKSITDIAHMIADECEYDTLPLAGAIEVLEACIDQIVEHIGAKIAYADLEPMLFKGLWLPTPAASRIEVVLDELDEVMSQLFEFVQNQVIFQQILRKIFSCVVKVCTKILKPPGSKGGGSKDRSYTSSDAVIFVDDIESMEAWFVARDEDGNPQGIPVDEVEAVTLSLHNLVERQEYLSPK